MATRSPGQGPRLFPLAGGCAFAAVATLLTPSSALAAPPQDAAHGDAAPGRIGSILGTTRQVALDQRAVAIFNSAAVQKAVHDLAATYAQDPRAAYPDAGTTLQRAAAATGMASAAAVVNQDTDRPAAYWSVTSPHDWNGLYVPLAGLMVDNTDNIYRSIPIDGAARYEIRGQVVGVPPAQETFILHTVRSGADKTQKVRKQEDEAGIVTLDRLKPGPDGRFTITVDDTPTNGRPDHIQSDPDNHESYVLVRDTLSDWSRENPVRLEAVRTGGPASRPAPTQAELEARAASMVTSSGPYWLAWAQKTFFSHPVNSITFDVPRASGWGYIKCGYYTIKDDQALVVTIERRQAAALGFQLSDIWGQGQAPDFIRHTGSLNATQAGASPDGSYSYVISMADPGVKNWLDPSGLHAGTFCIRWQNLPAGQTADGAVRNIAVVGLADLPHALPAGTAHLSAADRQAQLRTRVRDFERRLTE